MIVPLEFALYANSSDVVFFGAGKFIMHEEFLNLIVKWVGGQFFDVIGSNENLKFRFRSPNDDEERNSFSCGSDEFLNSIKQCLHTCKHSAQQSLRIFSRWAHSRTSSIVAGHRRCASAKSHSMGPNLPEHLHRSQCGNLHAMKFKMCHLWIIHSMMALNLLAGTFSFLAAQIACSAQQTRTNNWNFIFNYYSSTRRAIEWYLIGEMPFNL